MNKLLILSADASDYAHLLADFDLPDLEVTMAADVESAGAQIAACNIILGDPNLVRALQQGNIGGAVLDVFAEEPLGEDSPLWTLPNVYITPHNAATSFPKHIAEIFAQNYRRFLRNEPLLYTVDFELGY